MRSVSQGFLVCLCVCAQCVCAAASGPHSSPDDNVAELKSLLRRSPDKLRDRDCELACDGFCRLCSQVSNGGS